MSKQFFNNMQRLNFMQFVQTYASMFRENINDFNNSFTELNITFADNLDIIIDNINIKQSDKNSDSITYNEVENKANLIKLGKEKLQLLFSYAKIAFADKQKVNQFGKADYQRAIRREDLLVDLLFYAWQAAQKPENNAVLIAAGMQQSDIDVLKTTSDTISELQAKIYEIKSEGKKITEDRNKLLAELKRMMEKINKASKVVFADNPALQNMFLLYPKAHRLNSRKRKAVKTTEGSFQTV